MDYEGETLKLGEVLKIDFFWLDAFGGSEELDPCPARLCSVFQLRLSPPTLKPYDRRLSNFIGHFCLYLLYF